MITTTLVIVEDSMGGLIRIARDDEEVRCCCLEVVDVR
jgi:hypothetical protein